MLSNVVGYLELIDLYYKAIKSIRILYKIFYIENIYKLYYYIMDPYLRNVTIKPSKICSGCGFIFN